MEPEAAPRALRLAGGRCVALAAGLLLPWTSTILATPYGLGACDEEVRAAPAALGSYECYAEHAEAGGDFAGSLARLEGILAAEPDNDWARLGLARLVQRRDGARTIVLAREAIDGFSSRGDRAGEAQARLRLFNQYAVRMQLAEAEAEASRAIGAAEDAGDVSLLLTIRVLQGRISINGGDAARSWVRLRGVELDPGFAELPPGTQALCFQLLHIAANMLDLRQTSGRYSARYAETVERFGLEDKRTMAHTQLAVNAQNAYQRGDIARDEALAVIREALRVVLEASDPVQEVEARLILSRVAEMDEAERQWAAIRARAGGAYGGFLGAMAALEQGQRLMHEDPPRAAEAIPLLEEAMRGTGRRGLPFYSAQAVTLLIEAYLLHEPDAAFDKARSGLQVIENYRDLQSVEELSARAFSQYTRAYYRIVDFHLDRGHDSTPRNVAAAFDLGERLRARTLLDHLRRNAMAPAGGPSAERRRAVLEEIARVQLAAMRSDATPADVESARRELERLENEELGLRAELSRADPSWRVPHWTELPSLAEVQAALAPDEALLGFLVPPDDAPRSWLFVVRAGDVRTFALPSGQDIDAAVRFWLGALQRRDGSDVAGSMRLYAELLAGAIATLPASVTRLVVLPDGPLHRTPLEALRPTRDAAPLARRFQLSSAPSAAVWLHLCRQRGAPGAARALVLADPEPTGSASWPETWRSPPEPASVGRLPHARREGRLALEALGGAGELLTGREASESYVKLARLDGFSVVHIAAHAILDAREPGRSAILLAPGGADEDGLLQAREIRDLDLGGSLVTLSACRTADGALFRGEGVMALARSLFQARARAVVGGLWPLEDRETARLMAAFYRHLSRGSSVAAALTEAKREMIEAGEPTAAWAGVVVLGNGELRPWPNEAAAAGGVGRVAWLVLLLTLVCGGSAWWLLRRRA